MNLFFKRFSLTKLDLFILVIIALLGIINLPYPLGDDQSLFITGAQGMVNGKVLYRDFWDFKPPGIYYFYYIAGSLFGFSEIGIHLLELICWLLLSFLLIIAFRTAGVFENKFTASLTPLFTAGIFYSLSTAYSLTQVEALINVFLFITLWLAVESLKSEAKKFPLMFLSGLIGGIVLTFKLMFLPIVGVFWLSIFLNLIFKQKENLFSILKRYLLPLALGFFLPIVLLFIYFLKMDLLEVVYKTFFIYPPRLVTETPSGGTKKLYDLFLWYANNFYPMLALAVFGIFIIWWNKRNLILINIVFWLILGIIIIIATRTSWWDYHLQLLNVPVGILFLTSVDFLIYNVKKIDFVNSWKGKLAFVLVLIIFFHPAIHTAAGKTKFFVKYISAKTSESRKEVIANLHVKENYYPYIYRNLDVLNQPDSVPGEIYIIGLPLFYYLSGRDQAVPINGWVLSLILHEQWKELNDQLRKNKPVYIFIDSGYWRLVSDLSPETFQFIKKHYSVISYSNDGTWFLIKEESNKLKGSNH
jgi:hypothetical protein